MQNAFNEARQILNALRSQVGFKRGGEYYEPSAPRSRYVCEAYFDANAQLYLLGIVSEESTH